jgi:adenine-specific DNA-methyltransferase
LAKEKAVAQIQFKGKPFVQNHHLLVKYHELVPVKSKSLTKKVSLHDNLIIHGDNLKGLKALLPLYAGKIKCIYIDPPYNTGNEKWIYNDNVNSPMMQEWLGKVVDREDLTRHDKWLCMMLPRLKLLKELLRNDGVIFISVDDNELYHLRVLLDEVFGEENWVGTAIWRNVTDNNPTNIAIEHEYIIFYAKNKTTLPTEWKSPVSDVKDLLVRIGKDMAKKNKTPESLKAEYDAWYRENKSQLWPLDRYKYIDNEGIYTGSQSVHNPGREGYRYDVIHPITRKPCKQPLMGYRFPEETMKDLIADGKILFGDDETKIIELKLYAWEYKDKLASVVTLDGRLGAYELRQLFPEKKKVFDNPKPLQLLSHLLGFLVGPEDIVLDSFAGSGTTAHALLKINRKDSGNRRFILIECEDYADSITAERVRRVIKGVPSVKDEALKKGLGGTFSFFELGKPIELESILDGDDMPSYNELARYVFYTATGEEFDEKKVNLKTHFIGESRNYQVYLFYVPKVDVLKGMAFTLDKARALPKLKEGKRRLVFAPTKYLDQDHLDQYRIDFAQLPFEIYELTR